MLKHTLATLAISFGVLASTVLGDGTCSTPSMGQCGSIQTGALCCPAGHFCQPWNPSYYQCIPAPKMKCPAMMPGVDFYGNDLETKYGLLPNECCDACYASSKCRAFTFVNYNPDGQSACYLKSGAKEKRELAGAVSGLPVTYRE